MYQALSLSDCELKNRMCTRCCGLLLLDPQHLVQTCKNKTKPGMQHTKRVSNSVHHGWVWVRFLQNICLRKLHKGRILKEQ